MAFSSGNSNRSLQVPLGAIPTLPVTSVTHIPINPPPKYTSMDFFPLLRLWMDPDHPEQPPVDSEDGGTGNNTYCVIA